MTERSAPLQRGNDSDTAQSAVLRAAAFTSSPSLDYPGGGLGVRGCRRTGWGRFSTSCSRDRYPASRRKRLVGYPWRDVRAGFRLWRSASQGGDWARRLFGLQPSSGLGRFRNRLSTRSATKSRSTRFVRRLSESGVLNRNFTPVGSLDCARLLEGDASRFNRLSGHIWSGWPVAVDEGSARQILLGDELVVVSGNTTRRCIVLAGARYG